MGNLNQNRNNDYLKDGKNPVVKEKKSIFFYFVLTGFCAILMMFMIILYINNKKTNDMGGWTDESIYYTEENSESDLTPDGISSNIETQLAESEDTLSEIYTSLMFGSYSSDSGQMLTFDGNGNVVKKGGVNSGSGTYHLSYSTQKDLYTIEILINGITYCGTANSEIMKIKMEDGSEFTFD